MENLLVDRMERINEILISRLIILSVEVNRLWNPFIPNIKCTFPSSKSPNFRLTAEKVLGISDHKTVEMAFVRDDFRMELKEVGFLDVCCINGIGRRKGR